jgi:hypothetical protein
VSTPGRETPHAPENESGRVPLRISMVGGEDERRSRVAGAWWPQSRDLMLEMADLIQHFPPGYGRVVRAIYSTGDWDTAPRKITAGPRTVVLGPGDRDGVHLITVLTYDRERLDLVVVPPRFTAGQGAEAMLAAATPGNTHSAAELLAEVTDQPETTPGDEWDSYPQ